MDQFNTVETQVRKRKWPLVGLLLGQVYAAT